MNHLQNESAPEVTEPHLTKCGEPRLACLSWGLSSVFANMFRNPRPTTANMRNDGCPVIELTDSAEDWEMVLKLRRYVQIQSMFSVLVTHTNGTAMTSSKRPHYHYVYLRLGTKYNMTEFRADAVKRLTYIHRSWRL